MRCLAALLPADTEAAAGALIDGTPGVLAIAGQGLFVVIFEPTDEDTHEPVVERLPLTAEAVTLRIREHQRKLPSGRRTLGEQGGNVDPLVRQWTLTWPGSRRVSFSSVVRRFGGFDTGPDAAEPFGETLAGRLGWTIPA